jgi:glycosyltransferase involved in cell wall biosynthesis/peptidoglycan/xylan/chitin deacetylase (PgdA/CDA1 family)
MKILYHHRTRGIGAEGVHIASMINALKKLGHSVEVISPVGIDPLGTAGTTPYKEDKVNINKIWGWISRHFPQVVFEILEICYNFLAYIRIKRAAKINHIDFIYERYAYLGLAGVIFAKRNNLPLILEVNEVVGVIGRRKRIFMRVARFVEKMIFWEASYIVVISDFLKSYIEKIGIPSEKISVIPNAVDPERFNMQVSGEEVRKKINLDNKIAIGFVGWFASWHKIDFLLHVFNELVKDRKDLQLLLIGDGPKENLKRIIREKEIGSYVTFTGSINHQQLPNYIAAMDICIVPHSNEFRSPIKLFEYMAMGKPTIAPRFKPIEKIIIHNGNGILFEPGNKDSLKDAIIYLADDKKKREEIGNEARKTILKNYLWKNNAQMVVNIIEKHMVTNRKEYCRDFKIPILVYHRIAGEKNRNSFDNEKVYVIDWKRFENQVRYLKEEGYQTITLDDYAASVLNGKRLPTKPIIITFDDGYMSHYDYAYPILKKHGFTATIFVTLHRHCKEFQDLSQFDKPLSEHEIREMSQGGISIQSHTITHRSLVELSPYEIRMELIESKRKIEEITGQPVHFLASPYGFSNRVVKTIAKEVGYLGLFANLKGTNTFKSDLYALRRIGVYRDIKDRDFAKFLNPSYEWQLRILAWFKHLPSKMLGSRGTRSLRKYMCRIGLDYFFTFNYFRTVLLISGGLLFLIITIYLVNIFLW